MCPEFGRGSTDGILCFSLKGSRAFETELLTDGFKFRFMLIKKLSGVLQLTRTLNKSVKPLLILTGLFFSSGRRLPIGKA